jgi:indole-3-glycerol phosphate synthase
LYLEKILAAKRAEIASLQALRPLPELKRLASEALPQRDFVGALRGPGLAVVAEVKRASPSKGAINPGLDPAALSREYQAGGCAAISVLTDRIHFGARDGDLERVRRSVSVPVLRKDFLLTEYQLWETRAMGADAALLIVGTLGDRSAVRDMIALALDIGLCPLVEVHDEEETLTALDCGAPVVGINNRDLQTFRVSLDTTHRLASLIPREVALVSESGIAKPADAAEVFGWGVDAVLVGEALVRSQDPAGLVRAFAAISAPDAGAQDSAVRSAGRRRPAQEPVARPRP